MRTSLKTIAILLSLFVGSTLPAIAASVHCTQEVLEKIFHRVRDGEFEDKRALKHYLDHFETYLWSDLDKLKAKDTWIDMGSGESFAIQEYLMSYPAPANVIGVTVKKPVNWTTIEHTMESHPNKLKVLYGRFLEEIAEHELPKAKLITDLMGPFSYSAHPDQILQRYLDLLEVNGTIHLSYASVRNSLRMNPLQEMSTLLRPLSTSNGGLGPWLKSIDGIEVYINNGEVFIRKLRAEVKVPELELVKPMIDEMPPYRSYRSKEKLRLAPPQKNRR